MTYLKDVVGTEKEHNSQHGLKVMHLIQPAEFIIISIIKLKSELWK